MPMGGLTAGFTGSVGVDMSRLAIDGNAKLRAMV